MEWVEMEDEGATGGNSDDDEEDAPVKKVR
jgi:hypothetical protein